MDKTFDYYEEREKLRLTLLRFEKEGFNIPNLLEDLGYIKEIASHFEEEWE